MILNVLKSKYKSLALPLKAGVWFFICNVIQKGISFITTPIFTRIMSMEQYGLYTIFQSWRDILSIFICFGLSSSVYMKKMVELDSLEERNKLTCSLQGLATLTTLSALLIYLLFRDRWNSFTGLPTSLMLTIFVSVYFTTSFDFWAAREKMSFRYTGMVIVTIIVAFVKPVLAILLMRRYGETAYVRIIVATVVELLLYSYMLFKNFSSGEKLYHRVYWKYAITFVLPLIPHYLSQRVLSQSDRIMIGRMIGEGEAAIYGLANSVGLILMIVVTSCDNVIAPWVYSRIKSKEYGKIRKVSLLILIMMALLSIGVIAIAPEIIRFFGPEEYYDAVWTLPPLTISVFFSLMYLFFIYFEYYYENTKLIMVATIASAAMNVGLNFYCIRRFGYIAAGYTTLFCYMAYTLFHYFVFRKTCSDNAILSDPYDLKAFVLISIVIMALGFGIMALYPYPVIRYLMVAAICLGFVLSRKKIKELYNTLNKWNV